MTIAIMIMFLVSFNLVLHLFSVVFNYRKELTVMEAMNVAMAVGMTIGLVWGTYFGYVLSDHLFTSTIIAIVIGGVVGLCVGIPCCLLSTIDGMLSGVMGGMMGAMLGVMLPLDDWNLMLKLLFLLQLVTLCTIRLYVPWKYGHGDAGIRKPIRKSILFTVVLFISVAVFLFSTDIVTHGGPNDIQKMHH